MIYFDNAATSAHKPAEVAQAMLRAMTEGNLGNPARGSHDDSLRAFHEVYHLREVAATFFDLDEPLNVALTHNATDSLNRVLKGYFKAGDHVITTVCEHNSVLRPLYQMEKEGLEISLLGIDEKARLRYDILEEFVKPNTKAVVITAASNVTGNGTDLAKVSEFCKKHGLKLFVDGSQAAGSMPLSMKELGIDVLCLTGHKSLYGPQGTGLILVQGDLAFEPVFAGGSGAHSFDHEHPATLPDVFESGTLNTPGAMGLAAGMEYLETMGPVAVMKKLKGLEERFVKGLAEIPGIKTYGDFDLALRTPTIALNIGTLSSSEVAAILNEDYQIAVRPGAHCAPRLHEALGTEEQGILRFSFCLFNTEEEVDEALRALKEIAQDI